MATIGRASLPQATLGQNLTNREMVAKIQHIVDGLLSEMLVRGFFGAGTVKFTVQDGTIQVVEECLERKHR